MKALCTNGRGEFISTKLKNFCDKKGIAIKYITLYMHQKNKVAK